MAEHQEAKKKGKIRRFYDYSLVFTIIFLTVFGLIMIYSSSSYSAQLAYDGDDFHFVRRQGLIALAFLCQICKVCLHTFLYSDDFGYHSGN